MMLFKFVKLYSKIKNRNPLLVRVRFYSLLRFALRRIFMLCTPLMHGSNVLQPRECVKEKVIVSLTTFPARFKNLWIVLESLLGQSVQPDKIIVWLCRDEVPSLEMLPFSLKKMTQRGVEFCFCEKNLRSYNKFYYVCQKYPSDCVITVDDDIVYPKQLVENLLKLHEKYPNTVCCNIGMQMTLDKSGDIDSLQNWKISVKEEVQSPFMMAQGVGGVLYPSGALHPYTFRDDIFMKVCPKDDDTWLQVMEYMNGVNVVKGEEYYSVFSLSADDDVKLCESNAKVDTKVRVNKIRKYIQNDLGFDPYKIWR